MPEILNAVYAYDRVIINKGTFIPVLPDNYMPAYGEMVYGFIKGNYFYIITNANDEQLFSYINPLNRFTCKRGRSDMADFIDGDRYLIENGMFFGLFDDFLMIKASEKANIVGFKNENLLRIVAKNRQDFSDAFSMQSWGKDLTVKLFDGSSSENIKILAGKHGDGMQIYVVDNDTYSESFGKCLSKVHIKSDGGINFDTIKSVYIGKRKNIQTPQTRAAENATSSNTKSELIDYSSNQGGSILTDDKNGNIDNSNSQVEAKNAGWVFSTEEDDGDEISFFKIREDGSIALKGPKGSFLEFNANGDINVSSANKMNLNASSELNSLSKSTNIRSKKHVSLFSDESDLLLGSGEDIKISAQNIVSEALLQQKIKSYGNIDIASSLNINIESLLTATITSNLLSLYSTLPMILANLVLTAPLYSVVPGVGITSLSPPLIPTGPSVAVFSFDPDSELSGREIYRPLYCEYSNNLKTWTLTNISLIKNGTLPYPGLGAAIKRFEKSSSKFISSDWKIN